MRRSLLGIGMLGLLLGVAACDSGPMDEAIDLPPGTFEVTLRGAVDTTLQGDALYVSSEPPGSLRTGFSFILTEEADAGASLPEVMRMITLEWGDGAVPAAGTYPIGPATSLGRPPGDDPTFVGTYSEIVFPDVPLDSLLDDTMRVDLDSLDGEFGVSLFGSEHGEVTLTEAPSGGRKGRVRFTATEIELTTRNPGEARTVELTGTFHAVEASLPPLDEIPIPGEDLGKTRANAPRFIR